MDIRITNRWLAFTFDELQSMYEAIKIRSLDDLKLSFIVKDLEKEIRRRKGRETFFKV